MKEILDGILEAIEDEQRAQIHYQKLADKTDDLKVKKVFEQMKIEEEGHERLLRSRYEALSKVFKEK